MKVVVDQQLCEGNMRCQEAAPEVFEVGDDDKSRVLIGIRPKACARKSSWRRDCVPARRLRSATTSR